MTLTAIGFDADDTLWENERYFRKAQARFEIVMADYVAGPDLMARLLLTEARNVKTYGYGVKSFTLSMIETAIEVSNAKASGALISEILSIGRDVFHHRVELLPHAAATLQTLARRYRLILVTKGDLVDQERKLTESGLFQYFDHVEIVSQKFTQTYETIFTRHADGPHNAMMVGNSMRSDVLPMIDAGGYGVHVPTPTTWALEHAERPENTPRFAEIDDLGSLPETIESLLSAKAGRI